MKTLTFSTEGKYSESVSALAISYLRWSSVIQGTGDTLRRQTDKIGAWLAARPHAKHAQELIDAGVSAFKGKEIKDGAFGALLTAVQEGKIPRGTYLLVESLDRISRLTPEEALTIFLQLINAGIIIVTRRCQEWCHSSLVGLPERRNLLSMRDCKIRVRNRSFELECHARLSDFAK